VIEKESGVDEKDEAVIEQEIETKRIGKIEEVTVDEDDDDWEGIERSELEKTFVAAAKFVNTDEILDLASVDGDVQMELYALHKVATEGPCRESQPMALMMSARAKWNAWQRLGNMSPEMAMERYIFILSEKVPRWMEEHSAGDSKQEPSETQMPTSKDPDLSTLAVQDPPFANERTPEMKPNFQGGEVTSGSSVENQVKEDEHSS
jgi:acyl-CoA-binding protein